MKKKGIALIAALVLLAVSITAGSLAWLTDTTDAVKNTFTTSNIGITLSEDTGGANHEFKMIPGWTIEKDPKVTLEEGSEPCWLFVKLEKSDNFDTYIEEFDLADGWGKLDGVDGVYCRMVEDPSKDPFFYVISGNELTVRNSVTKTDMESAKGTEPTLTVTAYACQLYSTNGVEFDAATAWEKIHPSTTPTT